MPPYGVPVKTIGVPLTPSCNPATLPNVIALLEIALAVVDKLPGVQAKLNNTGIYAWLPERASKFSIVLLKIYV